MALAEKTVLRIRGSGALAIISRMLRVTLARRVGTTLARGRS